MDIDKLISGSPQGSLNMLKDRLANSERVLAHHPEHAGALQLRSRLRTILWKRPTLQSDDITTGGFDNARRPAETLEPFLPHDVSELYNLE